MKASTDAPATHYRLSDETIALAVADYMDGATAKDVAAKWKTSAGSVYRWAAILHPGGKRGCGDARARAHARMVEEEEAAARALNPVGSRALKGLFAPERTDGPDAGDPQVLMRLATVASGRAMTGRLWAEAKVLAGLAEAYSRLAGRAREAEPEEDPTEPGGRAALALLRQAAIEAGEITEAEADAMDTAAAAERRAGRRRW